MMEKGPERKIIFFGCPLDGDERHESIQEKLSLMGVKEVFPVGSTFEEIIQGIEKVVRAGSGRVAR